MWLTINLRAFNGENVFFLVNIKHYGEVDTRKAFLQVYNE